MFLLMYSSGQWVKCHELTKEIRQYYWLIGEGTRDRLPASQSIFFSFSCSFRQNIGQIIGERPLRRGWLPSLEKFWVRH